MQLLGVWWRLVWWRLLRAHARRGRLAASKVSGRAPSSARGECKGASAGLGVWECGSGVYCMPVYSNDPLCPYEVL